MRVQKLSTEPLPQAVGAEGEESVAGSRKRKRQPKGWKVAPKTLLEGLDSELLNPTEPVKQILLLP